MTEYKIERPYDNSPRTEYYLDKDCKILHRDNDLPAIEFHKTGTKQWYQNGVNFRENDLPAIEYGLGTTNKGAHIWHNKEGRRHRDNDLPAYVSSYHSIWYRNGCRHRDNDLPAVEYHESGDREWWQRGFQHRLTGPAGIYDTDTDAPSFEYHVEGEQIFGIHSDKDFFRYLKLRHFL